MRPIVMQRAVLFQEVMEDLRNASSLLIARVSGRRQELALRSALGASRSRVVRHRLAESVLLAVGAVALGTGLAWSGMQLLQAQGAAHFPRTQEIRVDASMIWLMVGLAASSALIFAACYSTSPRRIPPHLRAPAPCSSWLRCWRARFQRFAPCGCNPAQHSERSSSESEERVPRMA